MKGLFITGTDTGIGKTLVSAALLRALSENGLRCAGMKPVAAGFVESAGRWINDDVEALKSAASVAVPDALINPCALREPLAPHIAAEHEGRAIDIPAIRNAARDIAALADIVIVEGVGGFRVPLTSDFDTADLAAEFRLPVVLVVGMRLGCLNHALLTAEAIRARGLQLAGWVANSIDPAMPSRDENIATLDRMLGAPRLGVIPHLALASMPGAQASGIAASHIHFDLLKGLLT